MASNLARGLNPMTSFRTIFTSRKYLPLEVFALAIPVAGALGFAGYVSTRNLSYDSGLTINKSNVDPWNHIPSTHNPKIVPMTRLEAIDRIHKESPTSTRFQN